MGINKSDLKGDFETFCCPECHSELECPDSGQGLICSGCKKYFPILDFLPDFRPQGRQGAGAEAENLAKKEDYLLGHRDVFCANRIFYDEIGERYESIPEAARSSKNIRVQLRAKGALQMIREKYSLGERLLDLGCGTGFLMDMARGIFAQSLGLDCSEGMLRVARAKGHRVCLADAVRTPLRRDYFDLVATNSVLHHLHDPFRMVSEAFRILKPKGIFFADFEPNFLFQRKLRPDAKLYRLAERLLYGYSILSGKSVAKIGPHKDKCSKEFLNRIESICEFHHYKTKGLKESKMRPKLKEIGFRDIEIIFHGNCESLSRPRIPLDERIKSLAALVLSGNFSFIWDWKFKNNACHIAVLARKP